MPVMEWYDHRVEFDPAGDLEAFLERVPARWAVYLMVGSAGEPVQLLCVKNLRASLRRRLGGTETVALSRRVNYREVVRAVCYRRVDSDLEADWIYLEAARQVFPATYQGMVGRRTAWFVHVDPGAEFPRYTKRILDRAARTDGSASALWIGPVEDKHAAQRLIELVEDCFDLCRYHNVLVQAPHGTSCAYKEMGRCAAPCDGSVSMESYRQAVAHSAAAIVDPQGFVDRQRHRMAELAAQLQFEQAARVKARIDKASELGRGAFRYARPLAEFAFVSVQRGPRQGTAKVFLIHAGGIEQTLGLIDAPDEQCVRSLRQFQPAEGGAAGDADCAGLVAGHLFSVRRKQGLFIRISELDRAGLTRAWSELLKQRPAEQEEGEGLLQELEAVDPSPRQSPPS